MRNLRFAGIVMIVVIVLLIVAAPAFAFSDVQSSDPYAAAITDLATRGLISGYDDGTFRPENPVFRAQFAKMIAGVLGLTVSEALTSPFSDLGADDPTDLYPHEYVAAAWAAGITKGFTPTTFGPYRTITRAQVITMIVRAADAYLPGSLLEPPAAWWGGVVPGDPTHAANIRRAEYNDLLSALHPYAGWAVEGEATRGEVAELLYALEHHGPPLALPDTVWREVDSPLAGGALQVAVSSDALVTVDDDRGGLRAYLFATGKTIALPSEGMVRGAAVEGTLVVWSELPEGDGAAGNTVYSYRLPDGPQHQVLGTDAGVRGFKLSEGRLFFTTGETVLREQYGVFETIPIWELALDTAGQPVGEPALVTRQSNYLHQFGGDALHDFAVSGHLLAYQRDWGVQAGIHLLDLDTREDIYVGAGSQPSLAGDLVAWQGWGIDRQWAVRVYDHSTGLQSILAADAHGPVVTGAGIAYLRFVPGMLRDEVVFYETASGRESVLGTRDYGDGYHWVSLAVSGGRLAWVTEALGDEPGSVRLFEGVPAAEAGSATPATARLVDLWAAAAPPPALASGAASWPESGGWTIVLASIENDGPTSEARAEEASWGLPDTFGPSGLFLSDGYSSLEPGYWIVFVGIFATKAEAEVELTRLSDAGVTGAVVREVRP